MKKYVKPRQEISRKTDIELVRRNLNVMVENDILVSQRLDKDVPRIPVQYGDEVALNQPSIALEDMPTDAQENTSQLASYVKHIESQLANAKAQHEEEEKQKLNSKEDKE